MATLPAKQQASARKPGSLKHLASTKRVLSARPQAPSFKDKVLVAQSAPARKGLILDYSILQTITNFVFRGDSTYLCVGPVNISGTTWLEGGTVVKAIRDDPTNRVWVCLLGPVICQTDMYRPAVFTSKDDDTIGEWISAAPYTSTGTPTGTYAQDALQFSNNGMPVDVSNIRVRNANVGLSFYYGGPHTARNVQGVNCGYLAEVYSSGLKILNALCYQATKAVVITYGSPVAVQNLTANEVAQMVSTNALNGLPGTLAVTNSLLVSVTNASTFTKDSATPSPLSGSGVFQTVGAGAHYLAANSPYRNAATSAIDPALAVDLKKKTTYPPLVLTNAVTVNTTLAPQVQRDTDTFDLGFYYDCLDYALTGVIVQNAALTLTNGVAIGTYGTAGIYLGAGAKLLSEGSPTNPNRLGHVNRVQEQPTLVAGTTNSPWLVVNSSGPPPPEIKLAFSDVSLLSCSGSTDNRRLVVNAAYYKAPLSISDSYLRGVSADFYLLSAGAWTLTLRNNRFERYYLNFLQDSTTYYPFTMEQRNNTFVNGQTYYGYSSTNTTWTVTDNLYDTDHLYRVGVFSAANNGYRSGLLPFVNDPAPKTGLVMDYQPGLMTNQLGILGNYYYPTTGGSTSLTNLINTGSRTASAGGLYHYTVLLS